MIIYAVDLGIKNPAYTVFKVEHTKISVIALIKSNWTKNWEHCITTELTYYKPDIIILEKQGFKSPNNKIIYFIKGFFYNTHVKVIVKNPPFTGINYKSRKNKSIQIFLEKISLFIPNLEYILHKFSKLDDIADSFNLGLAYIIDLKLEK